MSARKPVVVVDHANKDVFEDECAQLIESGYRMASSSCSFIDSEQYNYCSVYQAIFVDKSIEGERA